MWTTVWSYEDRLCNDCTGGIWTTLIFFGVVAFLVTFFWQRHYQNLGRPITVLVAGRRYGFWHGYAAVVVLLILHAGYDFYMSTFHYEIPDDYYRLQEAIAERGPNCIEGRYEGQIYRSNLTQIYDSLIFEDGSEFRYQASDYNRYCFGSARIWSGITRLVKPKFGRIYENKNVELRICSLRNVNSNFDDSDMNRYAGICIYQIDARFIEQ